MKRLRREAKDKLDGLEDKIKGIIKSKICKKYKRDDNTVNCTYFQTSDFTNEFYVELDLFVVCDIIYHIDLVFTYKYTADKPYVKLFRNYIFDDTNNFTVFENDEQINNNDDAATRIVNITKTLPQYIGDLVYHMHFTDNYINILAAQTFILIFRFYKPYPLPYDIAKIITKKILFFCFFVCFFVYPKKIEKEKTKKEKNGKME